MREFKIISPGVPDSEIPKIENKVEEKRKEALRPVANEIPKTPEQIAFIGKYAGWINEELKKLGIQDVIISPDRIHVVRNPGNMTTLDFIPPKWYGFSNPLRGYVQVNKVGDMSRRSIFRIIGHELVHLGAHLKVQGYSDIPKEGRITRIKKYFLKAGDTASAPRAKDVLDVSPYRTGYKSWIVDDKGDSHEHFRGFNEAITEKINGEILEKHWEEIRDSLRLSEEERLHEGLAYEFLREVLDIIIEKVSQKQNKTKENVWEDMKRGYFTGEMMHMREIEKTFGIGSLRVLAAMGNIASRYKIFGKQTPVFKEYFLEEDLARREIIAQRILRKVKDKDELAAYQRYSRVAKKTAQQ